MVQVVLVLARFSVGSDESRNKDIHTCVFWHKLHTAVTNRGGTVDECMSCTDNFQPYRGTEQYP